MSELEFEVIPDSERPERRRGGGHISAITAVLLAGQTVFAPGLTDNWVGGRHAFFKRHGMILHQRKVERGGVAGVVLWAEPRDAT